MEKQLSQNEVQRILEAAQASPPGGERRHAARRPYPFLQAFAPYDGTELPRKKDLRKILCQDLSTTGVSVLLPDAPAFEHMVLRLGRTPNVIYVTARVVRAGPHGAAGDGFAIGCSFLGKVSLTS